MSVQHNDFDELGAKVQRAQYALEQARGVGVVNGIRVIVDAEYRLLSVNVDEAAIIVAAYQAAVDDVQSKVEEATRELRADPHFEALSTFTEANTARLDAEQIRREQQLEEDEDRFYEEHNRRGWFVK
ncbi:hypothetical protein [Nocardia sp. NPDC051570]|uniref:hypothetical protein n=1 Tax=Nocardia sp. NPDC051570 TaxID=3364324 RepID=UPI00378CFA42